MDPYSYGAHRPGPYSGSPNYVDAYGPPLHSSAPVYPAFHTPAHPGDYAPYPHPPESSLSHGPGYGFPTYDQGPSRPYDAPIYSRPKLPKLYVAKISTNCLGPWLLLKEAGIPFELVEVDLTRGDNHTNEFLAMNPLGQVPTYVETDGTVIWESNAIMRFICEKHTVPRHLYPKDVNLRGRIEMGLDWRQTVLYPNIAKVCFPALGFTKDRSRVAEGRESLEKDLRILSDFFLRETPFIGGALPCIADYAIGMPLLYLYATDFRIPPKIREYMENLASKSPSWNEVTEELKRYISRL